jgi:phenylalanyl-tRNA synthetase alpha chain
MSTVVTYNQKDSEQPVLTPEAEDIVENGSHEYKVWSAVKREGRIKVKNLDKFVPTEYLKVGQGNAFKRKWVKKEGDELVPIADAVEDSTKELLEKIKHTKKLPDLKVLTDLKKRQLLTVSKVSCNFAVCLVQR